MSKQPPEPEPDRLDVYFDPLTGGYRILCQACVRAWQENRLGLGLVLTGSVEDPQDCLECENCQRIRLDDEGET